MDAFLFRRARRHASIALAALLATSSFSIAHAASGGRYALNASASLHSPPATQRSDRFSLKATLAQTMAGASTGGGYQLGAKLAMTPLACLYDTIFRDGFDP